MGIFDCKACKFVENPQGMFGSAIVAQKTDQVKDLEWYSDKTANDHSTSSPMETMRFLTTLERSG